MVEVVDERAAAGDVAAERADGLRQRADLHVDAAAQGQRVGTQLLAWAEEEARRIGAKSMTLTTIPTNTGGIRLYERFGFKTTKTATSASYVKHTHIPGRVFMEKEIDLTKEDHSI